MKKVFIYLSIFIVSLPLFIGGVYYGFIFYAHDFRLNFLEIDRCLDNGDVWNYEKNVCEK